MTPNRRAQAIAAVLAALALSVAAVGCAKVGAETSKKSGGDSKKKAPPKKTAVVTVARPVEEEVRDFDIYTGRTEATQTIEVRARVTGYLVAGGADAGSQIGGNVLFQDGQEVEKDQLLFKIDERPYKAEQNRTASTLRQAEARQKRAEAAFRRVAALYARNASSRDEYDQAEDDFSESQAAVGIARAVLDRADLDVGFTEVRAPIKGRISRRMVDVGNLVKADDTILTTIVDIQRLYVYYDIDERSVLRIREMIRDGTFTSMTEGEVPVDIALVNDEGFPFRGKVNFYESKLDANSGTLRVRADIDNPSIRSSGLRGLSPGQFVKVRLPLGAPYKSLTVPEEALSSDQGKKFLYIFREWPPEKQAEPLAKQKKDYEDSLAKSKAKEGAAPPMRTYRFGTVEVLREKDPKSGQGKLVFGPLRDGRRVIREGIEPADEVIVTGLQGIRPNGDARVEIKSEAPPPEPAPVAGPADTKAGAGKAG